MTVKNNNKTRRNIKGGFKPPNVKAEVVVRRSNINEGLLYSLIIHRPMFPFLDYLNYNMNFVDEALSLIRPKEIPRIDDFGNRIEMDDNIIYKDYLEYGYNKPEGAKERELAEKKSA